MKNFTLILLTLITTATSYAQPTYHRIWGVKENRKVDNSYITEIQIFDDVVYYTVDNKINALQLPEATTETFIEIGTPQTTQIINKQKSTNGNWYIVGYTSLTEGFTTPNAYRTEFDDEQNPTPTPTNSFLAKYSATGELQWCTYIDQYYGSVTSYGLNITTDEQDNIYFVSYKPNNEIIENAPFQATANPEDFLPGTNKTPTLTKLDNNGAFQWSTFFGMHNTLIRDIRATTDGVVIAGIVVSTENFSGIPVSDFNYFSTEGAYQESPNTNTNGEFLTSVFVNKLNFDGIRSWGTYFDRTLRTIEVFENDIYLIQVHGSSSESVATEGVFIDEPVNMNGNVGLLGRLSSDGSELLWRTYLFNNLFKPGLHIDNGRIVNINSDGNIWLFGQTDSSTSVATDDAYQTEKNMANANNKDSYHLLLANDGSTVLYSSYYGFEGDDASIAIFPAENGYYSVEQTSGNSDAENFITQGNLLEPDEEGSSTYGGLVYTYFSTEPVSSGTFDKKKISIYPNPAENVLHLTGEIDDFTEVNIYNMQGQQVFQQPINAREIVSVDIASIASGVYLLTISNQNNKQTYRVVKK